ncbi:MAG: ribose 5-phosphate isomerase B [Bacteroidales bacterium]|nr:ribose 5-phosphate isomerase B [Bacteroidales bacterium]
MNKIAIACDHAAFHLKETVKLYLKEKGFEVIDYGTNSEESVDYPDIIHPLAKDVNEGKIQRAIIMCGSGIGVSIVANKYANVRCALCMNTELAEMSRKHNNANILSMGARFISEELALQIVDRFLNTEFEGGRHQRRVEKIPIH